MSWVEHVRPQLVKIIDGASPTVLGRNLPDRYRHVRAASEALKPSPRDYVIQVAAGSTRGPFSHSSGRRGTVDVQVVLYYRDIHEAAYLEEAMVSDYELISEELLTPTTWERSTSGIISIALEGDDNLTLDFEIVDDDQGAMLVLEFPVTYRRTP